jgi:hypothetical protein
MPNNKAIAREITRIRAPLMGHLIRSRAQAPLEMAAALGRGEHLGMLVDQHFSRGVDVTFFGRRCKANPSIARLARQFDCPVVGVRVIRLPGHRFRIAAEGPFDLPRDAAGRIDVPAATQMITLVIERCGTTRTSGCGFNAAGARSPVCHGRARLGHTWARQVVEAQSQMGRRVLMRSLALSFANLVTTGAPVFAQTGVPVTPQGGPSAPTRRPARVPATAAPACRRWACVPATSTRLTPVGDRAEPVSLADGTPARWTLRAVQTARKAYRMRRSRWRWRRHGYRSLALWARLTTRATIPR